MSRENRSRNPWLKDIPSVDEIIEQAKKRLNLSEDLIKKEPPYKIVSMLEKECHAIYSEYEKKVKERADSGVYGHIDQQMFMTSLANSRRARAGATLEKLLEFLLKIYKIPHEKNVHIQGEVEFDFVFPNLPTAILTPGHSVLLSVKREVRERWKLTVGDAYILRHKYGYPLLDNIWFISLGDPPREAITSMTSLCIRVYLPNDLADKMRSDVRKFLSEDEVRRIRKFSDIIGDILKIAIDKEMAAEECTIKRHEMRPDKNKSLMRFM